MMDYADWNRGLLLSELLIVIAGMSLVSARSTRDALCAIGVLVQGIVMTFAAGGAYFPRAEFAVATTALMTLLGLWSLWMNTTSDRREAASVELTGFEAGAVSHDAANEVVEPGPGEVNGER